MNIDAIAGAASANTKSSLAAEQVDRGRAEKKEAPENFVSAESAKKVQPEELLSHIKAITENGTYAVQFENNKNEELVIKVIDRETDEVIRQIPPEELQELTKMMNELTGNLVNTVG